MMMIDDDDESSKAGATWLFFVVFSRAPSLPGKQYHVGFKAHLNDGHGTLQISCMRLEER